MTEINPLPVGLTSVIRIHYNIALVGSPTELFPTSDLERNCISSIIPEFMPSIYSTAQKKSKLQQCIFSANTSFGSQNSPFIEFLTLCSIRIPDLPLDRDFFFLGVEQSSELKWINRSCEVSWLIWSHKTCKAEKNFNHSELIQLSHWIWS